MNRRIVLGLLGTCCAHSKAFATDPFVRQDIDTNKLPGTWQSRIGGTVATITFLDSGKFSGRIQKGATIQDDFEGEWSIKNQYIGPTLLLWEFTKSRTIPVGAMDRDELETLNDSFLIMWTRRRERRVYRRVVSAQPK